MTPTKRVCGLAPSGGGFLTSAFISVPIWVMSRTDGEQEYVWMVPGMCPSRWLSTLLMAFSDFGFYSWPEVCFRLIIALVHRTHFGRSCSQEWAPFRKSPTRRSTMNEDSLGQTNCPSFFGEELSWSTFDEHSRAFLVNTDGVSRLLRSVEPALLTQVCRRRRRDPLEQLEAW